MPSPSDVLRRLRDVAPNFVGLKVSDAPWEAFEPYLSLGLDVFVGPEALIHRGIEGGAIGAVSALASAFPEQVLAVVREPTAAGAESLGALRAAVERFPAAGGDEADPRGARGSGQAGRPGAPPGSLDGRVAGARRLALLALAPARLRDRSPSLLGRRPRLVDAAGDAADADERQAVLACRRGGASRRVRRGCSARGASRPSRRRS